jgi:phosphoribosylaminoimidazole-succinocarboxamide synthase
MEKTLLHKGSVKDVYEMEDGVMFDFSNRYSIYDWGKMPNLIENKGLSLSLTGMAFFDWLGKAANWKGLEIPEGTLYRSSALEQLKLMQSKGLKHHARHLCDENGEKKLSGSLNKTFLVDPVEVIKPDFEDGNYDYSFYHSSPVDTLVPLEVIFRFGVPKGSSLVKRAGHPKYIERLGVTADDVKENAKFEFPVIEFSTKLEHRDKYITYEEAQKIAGLHDDEFRLILNRTQLLALKLRDFFADIDVELWDGKFEFAFCQNDDLSTRDIMLVDSIGPDELRLTHNDIQLSKEVLRQIYHSIHPEWIKALEKSKKLAKERKTRGWKKICVEELKVTPKELSAEQSNTISNMYQALCNSISTAAWKKQPFDNVPTLSEIVEQIKNI